jgi:hypothetical protein
MYTGPTTPLKDIETISSEPPQLAFEFISESSAPLTVQ